MIIYKKKIRKEHIPTLGKIKFRYIFVNIQQKFNIFSFILK